MIGHSKNRFISRIQSSWSWRPKRLKLIKFATSHNDCSLYTMYRTITSHSRIYTLYSTEPPNPSIDLHTVLKWTLLIQYSTVHCHTVFHLATYTTPNTMNMLLFIDCGIVLQNSITIHFLHFPLKISGVHFSYPPPTVPTNCLDGLVWPYTHLLARQQ